MIFAHLMSVRTRGIFLFRSLVWMHRTMEREREREREEEEKKKTCKRMTH